MPASPVQFDQSVSFPEDFFVSSERFPSDCFAGDNSTYPGSQELALSLRPEVASLQRWLDLNA